jgi:hypothetical protein
MMHPVHLPRKSPQEAVRQLTSPPSLDLPRDREHVERLVGGDKGEGDFQESQTLMKCIEIIKLRTAGEVPESLKGFLSGLLKNGSPGLREARLYRHAAWETDWSLHLHWDSEEPEKDGSKLGLRLSQALKDFGLIDHSTWTEEVLINSIRREGK